MMALDSVDVLVAILATYILLPSLVIGYVFARYTNLFARLRLLVGPLGVDRRAALGPTLAFLVAFAWFSVADLIPEEGEPGSDAVVGALLAFGLGLFGVALALGNLGRYRRLRRGDAVTGVASVDGDTARAPLSDEPCLAWAVRIREHSGLFRRGAAPPVHRESGGTTFVVETATERVRVDPTGTTLDVWSIGATGDPDYAARGRSDAVPDRVTAFAADRELGEPDRSRVSEEVRIEAGDTVTVVGGADGADQFRIGGPGVVVDGPLDAVRRRTRRRVLAGPAGVALAGLSLAAAGLLTGAL